MAARPIWRGHLRLALVSCPVALYNARHDRAGIRFNLINPETGNRIRMITQDAETSDELERRSLVKGYEFRKGKYLLLSDDDLDSVKVESSSVMTIEKFVDTASIDPVYYNSAYYLVPDGDAGKDVYAVLREAIAKTGKTALSRVVIAQRERTIALRPMGEGLMAHTLYEDRDLNSSEELFAGVCGDQDRSGDGAARYAARAAAVRKIQLGRSRGPVRDAPPGVDRCEAQGRRYRGERTGRTRSHERRRPDGGAEKEPRPSRGEESCAGQEGAGDRPQTIELSNYRSRAAKPDEKPAAQATTRPSRKRA